VEQAETGKDCGRKATEEQKDTNRKEAKYEKKPTENVVSVDNPFINVREINAMGMSAMRNPEEQQVTERANANGKKLPVPQSMQHGCILLDEPMPKATPVRPIVHMTFPTKECMTFETGSQGVQSEKKKTSKKVAKVDSPFMTVREINAMGMVKLGSPLT
jgi:hypothetical protein